MSEATLMIAAPTAMQKAIEVVNLDAQKRISRFGAINECYNKLKNAQIENIPDQMNEWHYRYGFNVDVENPKTLGEIHKLVGKLKLVDKRPVNVDLKKRGRKTQEIVLVLTPENKDLAHDIYFHIKRKLNKNDKCKVVVETNKRATVVCSLK